MGAADARGSGPSAWWVRYVTAAVSRTPVSFVSHFEDRRTAEGFCRALLVSGEGEPLALIGMGGRMVIRGEKLRRIVGVRRAA